MSFVKIGQLAIQIFILFFVMACSDTIESEKKDVVEEATNKIAQEAIQGIRGPMDKATAVNNLTKDRSRVVEEATKEQ